nr:putative integron gene cassette protein [uncultured bacterium]
MKATDELKYPDFSIPASIVLIIGISLAVLQFAIGHNYHGWILVSMLIGAGLLMLARRKLGTVLLAGGIAYGLYWRLFVEGLSDVGLPKIALIAVIFFGLIGCLVGQVNYFVGRGKFGGSAQNKKA